MNIFKSTVNFSHGIIYISSSLTQWYVDFAVLTKVIYTVFLTVCLIL